jgi:hypothetical protein
MLFSTEDFFSNFLNDLCPHNARQWRCYLDNLPKGLTVNAVKFNHAYGNHFARCIIIGVFQRGSAREIYSLGI